MYRCGICKGVTEPREPMRRYVIYRLVQGESKPLYDHGAGRVVERGTRTRTEIEREIPVCGACYEELEHKGQITYGRMERRLVLLGVPAVRVTPMFLSNVNGIPVR